MYFIVVTALCLFAEAVHGCLYCCAYMNPYVYHSVYIYIYTYYQYG